MKIKMMTIITVFLSLCANVYSYNCSATMINDGIEMSMNKSAENLEFPSICVLRPRTITCSGEDNQLNGCTQICSNGHQAVCERGYCIFATYQSKDDHCYCR